MYRGMGRGKGGEGKVKVKVERRAEEGWRKGGRMCVMQGKEREGGWKGRGGWFEERGLLKEEPLVIA